MATSPAAIRLNHVGKTFNDQNGVLETLRDIHTSIMPEQFLCVLGPTGSGKTTLLRILAGLERPPKERLNFHSNAQPKVGLVFQESNLMPWRTVMDNILLPLELRGVDAAEAQRQASELVELVGLQDFTDVWPASFQAVWRSAWRSRGR